jgi:DNA-binding Lrp family transcriptional regulator
MKKLDELDCQILNLLQQEFPLSITPYRDLAVRLAISEQELLERIAVLKNNGVIRRIGGIINTAGIGFYSTLCACQVAENKIKEAAAVINSYPQVTHNYVRDHKQYNLWFTLTSVSPGAATEIILEMERRIADVIVSMPARKIYKIRVSFEMGPDYGI